MDHGHWAFEDAPRSLKQPAGRRSFPSCDRAEAPVLPWEEEWGWTGDAGTPEGGGLSPGDHPWDAGPPGSADLRASVGPSHVGSPGGSLGS